MAAGAEAAVASGRRPNEATLVAALGRLVLVKPPAAERAVYSRLLANLSELGKDIDLGHIAPLGGLIAQINREATQLHAPECKIKWP